MNLPLEQIAGEGLRVIRPWRSYAAPAVVEAMAAAGERLVALGLPPLTVRDASLAGGGAPTIRANHKSHKIGIDVDVQGTAPIAAADPIVIEGLRAANDAVPLEVVFASDPEPLVAAGLPGKKWPGHTTHVHARWPQSAGVTDERPSMLLLLFVPLMVLVSFLFVGGRGLLGSSTRSTRGARSSACDSHDLGRYSDKELRSLRRSALGRPRPGAPREELEADLCAMSDNELTQAIKNWEKKSK